jgi:large subunit ribosomal protein LP2
MRYVAAYLLAALGGNAKPSAADVKNILSSVGIDAEEDKLNKVIAELEVSDADLWKARSSRDCLFC